MDESRRELVIKAVNGIDFKDFKGGWVAYTVCTFEFSQEHACVGCGNAEGFVQKRFEVRLCLWFGEGHINNGNQAFSRRRRVRSGLGVVEEICRGVHEPF